MRNSYTSQPYTPPSYVRNDPRVVYVYFALYAHSYQRRPTSDSKYNYHPRKQVCSFYLFFILFIYIFIYLFIYLFILFIYLLFFYFMWVYIKYFVYYFILILKPSLRDKRNFYYFKCTPILRQETASAAESEHPQAFSKGKFKISAVR